MKIFALVAIVALMGCAADVLTRNGGTDGFNDDMRACEYEAAKYDSEIDLSMQNAVSLEIEQAMRRRNSQRACMKSKGWRPTTDAGVPATGHK